MSAVEHEVMGRAARSSAPDTGPVTAARRRCNGLVHAVVALLAPMPAALAPAPGRQAAGLGLLLPGAGFLARGRAWALLLPRTLGRFWLACAAWFRAGNVVALLAVWLGAALVAALSAGQTTWAPAGRLAPLAGAAVFAGLHWRAARQRLADRARCTARQGFDAESRAEVEERATAEAVAGAQELSPEQLGWLLCVFERALQRVGEYRGDTIIEQFQPAAWRDRSNHLRYARATRWWARPTTGAARGSMSTSRRAPRSPASRSPERGQADACA